MVSQKNKAEKNSSKNWNEQNSNRLLKYQL